jgi:L,D-transpeptidase YcbB
MLRNYTKAKPAQPKAARTSMHISIEFRRTVFGFLAGIVAIVAALIPVSTWADTPVANRSPATTKTEVLAGKNVAPMLSSGSAVALRQAEERYGAIAANGGWPKVTKAGLKKSVEGDAVATLNRRLYIEGYLRVEATQGDFATVFTTATQDAVARFQRNNGLAITGQIDATTLAALNVPAKERLRTIRENIPRLEIYAVNLGDRYLVVNVPAQQIETVQNGRVYSRHNAIVGRPERPTPVVITALSQVKFNPYWNAPASIVERDIIPKMHNGTQVLQDMNIKVFEGVGGPEVDPSTVDWEHAIADNYHFRQEPGPGNAMATAKIEFTSPFGIYLHDTPERQLFKTGNRFYSSGCVRVDRMDIMLNWVLNGQDGYNDAKISAMAETLERLDVPLVVPPQLRVVYLTAWPVGNTVAFRPDVYDLDGTEFTVGQPMPVGEMSAEGLRYTVKPIPRLVAQVDSGTEGGGLFNGFFNKGKSSNASGFQNASAKKKSGAALFDNAYDNGPTDPPVKAAATPDKKKSVGFFDWATFRKNQKVKTVQDASAVKSKALKAKPVVVPVKADAKRTVAAKSTAVTKVATTKLPAGKPESPAATKVATIKLPAAKPAAPPKVVAAKAVAPKAKAAKIAAKADCKPGKDDKLQNGCKVEAKAKAVVKPADAPVAN